MSDNMEVYKALLEFQKNPPAIKKDGQGPFSKYATLEATMNAVRPELNKLGIVITQHPFMEEDGRVGVTTKITHAESGECIFTPAMCVATKNDAQQVGSAITYLRRYGLSSILGIVTEDDDDGNATTEPATGSGKRTVTPEKGTKGEETPEEVDHRKRTLLWKIMLKMNYDITDDARKELKTLSGFKGKDGHIDGKETVADLKGQRLAITLSSAEKELEDWKKKEEEPVPAADPEQEDIEF